MNKINELKAVLFDYDGVIVKPDDNISAWKIACNKFGFSMTDNDWYLNEGLKPEEISEIILKKYGVENVTTEQLMKEKKEQYEIILNKNNYKVGIYNGISSVLSFLKSKGINIGLVTGSNFSRVNKSIPKIIKYFDVVVAADSLDDNNKKIRGKNFPDSWLFVLKKMNIPTEQCIAVENSIIGIRSVKMAGIKCIALQTTLNKEILRDADLIMKNHNELFTFFKKELYE